MESTGGTTFYDQGVLVQVNDLRQSSNATPIAVGRASRAPITDARLSVLSNGTVSSQSLQIAR